MEDQLQIQSGTYSINATGAGAGTNPEAVQITSNTGIKFQGQGNAANINFRSYNTNLNDSGDINFISETVEGQAGNITISSIATDAAGTAGEIRLLAEEISTSATDAAPLNLVIGSNGSVQTGSTVTSGTVTRVDYTTDISAFTAAGQPITSTGTLTLNKNGGSTGQYIDGGTGDWVNLPTQDTYTINAGTKSGTSVPLNLDALAGTDSTVNLTEGTGISLTRVSAGEIRIDGVAQGVTGSGTVGKLPKFDTTTSLNDSIIEQSGASNLSIDGELSMLTNKITNVVNPTNAQDAATKNYVDAIPTGVMTFGTSDSGATITVSGNAPDPRVKANTTGGVGAGSTSLATGAQIQTAITNSAANYLPLAGGTMTGAIALPGSPTLTLQAATKGYVDNTLAGSGSLIFQGSYDAVNNVPNLTSGTGILKGWTYAVTAGPSTSFWSPPLDVGDLVIANIDNPASASDWTEVQSNIGIAGSGTTDLGTVKGLAGFNSNDFTVSNSGWVEAKDFGGSTPGYVPDATGATAGTFLKEDGTWSTAGVAGTGTQNYVTKWSAGGAGIEDSTIFDNGTNVGIGTTSPSEKLEVVGNVTLRDSDPFLRLNGSNHAGIMIDRGSTSYDSNLMFATAGATRWRIWNDGSDDTLQIRDEANSANVMTWETGGNVGIGTTTPANNLHITGYADGDGLTIQRNSSASGAFADLMFSVSTADAATPNAKIRATRGSSYADTDISIITNSTERMRIDSSGNVGIGTASPGAKLEVKNGSSGQVYLKR